MSSSADDDEEYYFGPSYEFTNYVTTLSAVPRFGHGSDFTTLYSSNEEAQFDYGAGLISLFIFPLLFFILWTIAILTFKIMGPANAGFLSGHHFMIVKDDNNKANKVKEEEEETKKEYKKLKACCCSHADRAFRVRMIFLTATACLFLSSFLLQKGLTNANDATYIMSNSLLTIENYLRDAKTIASKLAIVGSNTKRIRDDAVVQLNEICPANTNIGEFIGMDIIQIANTAKADLVDLADFIHESLVTLDTNIGLVQNFTFSANTAMDDIDFWGWQMKLTSSGLFIFPSLFAVGVGLVMLGVHVRPYQCALSYCFMPLFTLTIIACYVICCLVLPLSAISADACSGGGSIHDGPDDTVLTIYRNLRGDDIGTMFQFAAYYTQRCNPMYYPFAFISKYLNDLDEAIFSVNDAATQLKTNQAILELMCGREFDDVLVLLADMSNNLKLLQVQANISLDLVTCEKVNKLYVNTFHEAGCTYSVDALGWIFFTSLIISIVGLIIIMLRSAYYPVEYITHETKKSQPTTSKDSLDHNNWGRGLSPPISSVGPLNETFSSNGSYENEYENDAPECEVPTIISHTAPATILFVPQWNEAKTTEVYPSDLAAEPAAAETQTALPMFVPRWDAFTSDDTSVEYFEEEEDNKGEDITSLTECEDSILVDKANHEECDIVLGKENRLSTPLSSLFCDSGAWEDFTSPKGKSWVDFMPSGMGPFFK